jgi:hypothetical protein
LCLCCEHMVSSLHLQSTDSISHHVPTWRKKWLHFINNNYIHTVIW